MAAVDTTLSIIIPAYNEEATILETLQRVARAPLPEGWRRETVIVDDGSTDGTAAALAPFAAAHRVVIKRNGGKGSAVKAGLRAATGDYALIQDADAEYDPNDYRALLAPIIAGDAEVVFGSRVLGGNNVPYKRVYYHGGMLVTKLFNLAFGTRLTDVATCYKVFPLRHRDALAALPADDFVFDVIELSHYLAQRGPIAEVPIRYTPRARAGGKKLGMAHGLRCAARLAQLYVRSH